MTRGTEGRRRRRTIAIRVLEVVAVVSVAGAVAVLASPPPERPPVQPPALRDPAADPDGDGVPNRDDLAPLEAAPRATATATAAPGRKRRAAPPPASCASLGITRRGGAEGTCTDAAGNPVTVVDRDHLLRLRELEVRYDSARVTRGLGAGAERIEARGRYVAVTITVRNRLDGVARFAPTQVELLLGDALYAHDRLAESMLERSFSWTGGEIARDGTATGTVVFDIPTRHVRRLDTVGNLVVRQFTDTSTERSGRTRGHIRTYR